MLFTTIKLMSLEIFSFKAASRKSPHTSNITNENNEKTETMHDSTKKLSSAKFQFPTKLPKKRENLGRQGVISK